MQAGRFRALSLSFALRLGRELYAERPLLHHEDPERAGRLAALIVCKAPEVNAALFAAPRAGCKPDEVQARLAEVGLALLASLHTRQRERSLTPVVADHEVWRRMAA